MKSAPSPRVNLPLQSKAPDFGWAAQAQLAVDGRPTTVLEVTVCHESEEDILAEASAWMSLSEIHSKPWVTAAGKVVSRLFCCLLLRINLTDNMAVWPSGLVHCATSRI